ncbi:MAG TPA: hypothetical protein VJT70_00155, partial [Sphingomicrobium sp.]|nr:hypothetical protein [Sphingomicrobium sp.]
VLAPEAFVEKGREIVAGREGRGRHKVVVSRTFKSACRAAPPWRGSNMRTWFNALPARAHPETASCLRLRCGQPHDKKRVPAPAIPGSPYALAKDGLPGGDRRPPDGARLSLEALGGQARR